MHTATAVLDLERAQATYRSVNDGNLGLSLGISLYRNLESKSLRDAGSQPHAQYG